MFVCVARHLPRALQEHAVPELHDVRLVDRRDSLAPVAPRRSAKANSAMRVEARSVMIFRLSTTPGTTSCSRPEYRSSVFSRTMTRSTSVKRLVDARQVPHRAQVRVQVERLAQADVDAGDALGDRRRHRPLQRDLVALDRVEQLHRQRLVEPLERQDAGIVAFPLDAEAGDVEDPDDGFGDFRPDAVAGNQRDDSGHVCSMLSRSWAGSCVRRAAPPPPRASSDRPLRTPPADRCRCRSRRAPRRPS